MSNDSHANDSNFYSFFLNLQPWSLDEFFPWLNVYSTLIFTFNILRFINRKNNQTEIVIIIVGCSQRNRHDAYLDAWKKKIIDVCKCKTFLSSVVQTLHFRNQLKSNKNNIKNDNGLERLDEGRFVLQGNHTAFWISANWDRRSFRAPPGTNINILIFSRGGCKVDMLASYEKKKVSAYTLSKNVSQSKANRKK